jgi:hypothetical protein
MKVVVINEDECIQFMLSYGHNEAIRLALCREGCVPAHKKLKRDILLSSGHGLHVSFIRYILRQMLEGFGIHKHVTKHQRMGRSDNVPKLAELNTVYGEISIQLMLLVNTVQLGHNVMK